LLEDGQCMRFGAAEGNGGRWKDEAHVPLRHDLRVI
jgi:hypothetical protein